jgi:uncharacterized membrane protein YphA (DoxX/SURF4 family)
VSWLKEERETYLLGLLRVLFAVLLLLLGWRYIAELRSDGYFGDFFHMSIVPESWVPSRTLYLLLVAGQALGCVLAFFGVAARPALLFASLCGLYGFFCDRLQYHNNRYELLLLTLLVALTPCNRSFSWGRPAQPGVGPRWAVRLVGAQLSVAYLASSLGKLADPDWRGGAVMLKRFSVALPLLESHGAHALAGLLAAPWFANAASIAAICSELFLALGLWFPRTRATALWLGVMFHIGIEVIARVELFSYAMLSGYLVFVTPELRERRLSWSTQRPLGPRLATLFKKLDVLARFEHEQVGEQAGLLVVCDREGRLHRGLSAWRELARAMPPLFPFWLPLRVLTFRQRDTTL